MTRLCNRITMECAACWMLRRHSPRSRKPAPPMSSRAPRCLPRLRTWPSAPAIPSSPQRGLSHECEPHFQIALWVAACHILSDRLWKSSFVRHYGFVFSGVAGLFCRGHLAYRPLTRICAPIRGDLWADCDLSEPDCAVRICIVAYAVSLNTEPPSMNTTTNTGSRTLGLVVSIVIVAGAVILGLIVLYR